MQSAPAPYFATNAAPDRVRNLRDTASLLGISLATLRRLIARGIGPKVVRVSDRRSGIRDSERERWLSERTVANCNKHEEAQ